MNALMETQMNCDNIVGNEFGGNDLWWENLERVSTVTDKILVIMNNLFVFKVR